MNSGAGVGLAHMIVNGGVSQVHLMVADPKGDAVARQWLTRAGVNPDAAMPTGSSRVTDPPTAFFTVERGWR